MYNPRVSRRLVAGAAWALLRSRHPAPGRQAAIASSPGCKRKVIGPLVANVPSVEVQPKFRLNGKPFPGAAAGVAGSRSGPASRATSSTDRSSPWARPIRRRRRSGSCPACTTSTTPG